VLDILHAAPGVQALVTSRTRLNVQGEHLLPVPGMDYPPVSPLRWGLSLPISGQRARVEVE